MGWFDEKPSDKNKKDFLAKQAAEKAAKAAAKKPKPKKLKASEVLAELRRGKTVHSPGQVDQELAAHIGIDAARKIAGSGLSAKEAKKLIGKRGGFETEGTIKSRGVKGNRPVNDDGSPRSSWW
jgi:hypothetical protein